MLEVRPNDATPVKKVRNAGLEKFFGEKESWDETNEWRRNITSIDTKEDGIFYPAKADVMPLQTHPRADSKPSSYHRVR
jgi:hypothetical protein